MTGIDDSGTFKTVLPLLFAIIVVAVVTGASIAAPASKYPFEPRRALLLVAPAMLWIIHLERQDNEQ